MVKTYTCKLCKWGPDEQLSHYQIHLNTIKHKQNNTIYKLKIEINDENELYKQDKMNMLKSIYRLEKILNDENNFNEKIFEKILWKKLEFLSDHIKTFNYDKYVVNDALKLCKKTVILIKTHLIKNIYLKNIGYKNEIDLSNQLDEKFDIIKNLAFLHHKKNNDRKFKKNQYVSELSNFIINNDIKKSDNLNQIHEKILNEINDIMTDNYYFEDDDEPDLQEYLGEEIDFEFKEGKFETKKIKSMVKQMHQIIYNNEALTPEKAMNDILMIILLKYIEDHIDELNFVLDDDLEEEIDYIKLSEFNTKNLENERISLCGSILKKHSILGRFFERENFMFSKKSETIIQLRQILYKYFPKNDVSKTNSGMGLACEIYMYFLKEYASSDSKLGQYFTPPHYVHLIISYLKYKFNISENFANKIIGDPFMGVGKMISMLLEIINTDSDNIVGIDIESDTYRYAFLNMFDKLQNIPKYLINTDSLIKSKYDESKIDLILTNPPFGLNKKYKDIIKTFDKNEINDVYPLINNKEINDGTTLCIMSCVARLNDNGLCAMILPDGKQLSGKHFIEFRKWLCKKVNIKTIIKAPGGIFIGTNVGTCVLIFEKNGKTKNIEYLETNVECNKLIKTFNNPVDIKNIKLNNYSFDYKDYIQQNININNNDNIKWTDLNKLFLINNFKTHKTDHGEDNGKYIFYTGGKKIYLHTDHPDINELCIILNKTNGSGKCNIFIDDKFSAAKQTILISSKNKNSTLLKYIYYYFRTDIQILERGYIGANHKNIKVEYIYNLKIPIPSIEIQNKIVEYLDQLNEQKQNLEKLIEQTKNEMKIHFDVFIQIHEIKWTKFGDVFDLEKGKISSGKVNNNDNDQYIYVNLSKTKNKTINSYSIDDLNIFINHAGNGDDIIIKYFEGKCEFSNLLSNIIIKKDYLNKINKIFYYYYLKPLEDHIAECYQKGLSNKSLNKDKLYKKLKIPIISIEKQNKIVDLLDKKNNFISNYKIRINELEKLMNLILENSYKEF